MRLFRNADYKFIEQRRKAYVISAVAILIGVVGMGINLASLGSWLNYGVDFTGGTLVEVRFQQPTDVAAVRSALGTMNPSITRFGSDNDFTVRVPLPEDGDIQDVEASIRAGLDPAFGAGTYEVLRTEGVGPKIGGELQRKAAGAILFSFLLTLIYLAFRFEWRFGVAAVIATAHDILITLGALALFRVEIALATVAAILTIVGYSLNDTIIVFDRIRENQNKRGAKKQDQIELVNRSINETLPRTVMTSMTTLIVLFALLLLGGPVIRDFTLVLILGIVVGTYSSIFVASPALIEIRQRYGDGGDADKRKRERQRKRQQEEALTAAV
ncbi:MAG: protein translocase subunit SecF [Gemmatimonadota bacterium]